MGTLKSQYQIPKVYALKNTSKIRENSQSGGAFTAFSDAVLSQGGVVYGCTLSEDFLAVHIRAVNSTDRDLMRGSKYIQSDLQDAFIRAKKDLDNGLQVLFTGTPCQIAGLRAFLGKAYDNLLIIDIVCNGVPSPKVWKSYLHWLEEKNKSSLYQTIFRDKKFGWKSSVETYVFTNGKVSNSKSFNRLFYKHLTVRPSCFSCPYKHIVHPGDITIGDFWGIDKAVPGYKDSKGVSLIMVNNSRGGVWLDLIKDNVEWKECRPEESVQPMLLRNYSRSQERDKFWKDYEEKGLPFILKKYGDYGNIAFLKRYIVRGKNLVKRIIKREG